MLCTEKDILYIVGIGAGLGKLVLIQGPVIAYKAATKKKHVVVIVPIKAPADVFQEYPYRVSV
jgi:hypothetical protein